MKVVKRDGSEEAVQFDKISTRIRALCDGLNPDYVDAIPVTKKVVEGLHAGITTTQIDELAAETCAYMSQRHPDYSILAARVAVSNLHKNTSHSFAETCCALYDHSDKQGREAALLSPEVWWFVEANATELDAAVKYERDFAFDYFG
mmetsp:Transcript_3012/g.4950  ORF Transcript_3012/g.4950 Transcript_3012/m.4950 type:complete len:147 (-) Transcript_3012:20-460(-)